MFHRTVLPDRLQDFDLGLHLAHRVPIIEGPSKLDLRSQHGPGALLRRSRARVRRFLDLLKGLAKSPVIRSADSLGFWGGASSRFPVEHWRCQGCPSGRPLTRNRQTGVGPLSKQLVLAFKVFGIYTFPSSRSTRTRLQYTSHPLRVQAPNYKVSTQNQN